jgi:hypothetical protein
MPNYDVLRLVRRYPFGGEVVLTDPQSESQLTGQTKEISLFGCSIDALKDFPRGTEVRITLLYQGAKMLALGKVVYARPGLGSGSMRSKRPEVIAAALVIPH